MNNISKNYKTRFIFIFVIILAIIMSFYKTDVSRNVEEVRHNQDLMYSFDIQGKVSKFFFEIDKKSNTDNINLYIDGKDIEKATSVEFPDIRDGLNKYYSDININTIYISSSKGQHPLHENKEIIIKFTEKIKYTSIFFTSLILFILLLFREQFLSRIISLYRFYYSSISSDYNEVKDNVGRIKFWGLFIIIFFIFFEILFPSFTDLTAWDELVYLNTSKQLVDDLSLWPYGRGPLISLFYSPIYLISKINTNINWLVLLSTFGRIFHFFVFYIGTSIIMNQIFKACNLNIVLLFPSLILLVPFFPVTNLVNPSYSLFTSTAIIAFYWILRVTIYSNVKESLKKNIAIFSFHLGLAGLARPDTTIIFPFIGFFLIFLLLKKKILFKKILKLSVYYICPFLFLVYGYIFFVSLTTGIHNSGSMKKMYLTFKSSEYLMIDTKNLTHAQWFPLAHERAEKIYGSDESNDWNIFKAISKNPSAFIKREIETLKHAKYAFAEAFTAQNLHKSYILLSIFLMGLLYLLIKNFYIGAASILWLSHLSLYFLTIVYGSYLLLDFFIFYIIFILGIIFLLNLLNIYIVKILLIIVNIILIYFYQTYFLLFSLFFIIFFNKIYGDFFIFSFNTFFKKMTFNLTIPAWIFFLLFSVYLYSPDSFIRNMFTKDRNETIINNVEYEKASNFVKNNSRKSDFIYTFSHYIPTLAKRNVLGPEQIHKAKFSNKKKMIQYLNERQVKFIVIDDQYFVKENPFGLVDIINKRYLDDTLELVYKSEFKKIKIYQIKKI